MNDENSKAKILIVDDAPMNIRMLGELLRGDYDILVANNGKKAIDIVQGSNPPDLILLDVIMPELDGYEVCKILKDNEITMEIPIIFITGKNSEDDEVKGLNYGAVDYITKPFNPTIVKARINTHLKIKRYQDLLKNFSFIDGLTGIANRRRFNDYINLTWNLSIREELDHSLIMMDIDQFKLYNDTYGHQMGDECLIMVSKKLLSTIRRKTDLIARYGGEEFACILPNTSKDEALIIAEKLRLAVKELKIEHKSSTVDNHITISLGVSTIKPIVGMDFKELIEKADKALYESKENGRDKVTLYNPTS
jgi:diguanylate cyclase (GGDEF)-like protein